MNSRVDHVVYAVKNLDEAVEDLYQKLGVKPSYGGRHLDHGTKNALLDLGDQCYLEIIAIDETKEKANHPHWMGLDLIEHNKVTRWCVKTANIKEDARALGQYKEELGEIVEGSRRTADEKLLKWKMTQPLDRPEVEIVPFVVDWSESEHHPTDQLEAKCKFMCIEFYHTEPKTIHTVLKHFRDDVDLKKGDRNAIYLYIESPKGIIKL
ncbi:VOC family protein [Portibacter marinus]|uniref:VOC family protein n=1 Tax=Portibacter marinus TaxID=2898660 RepID=UPI001F466C95|nr:VOC family protein [Portibacter marinus]